MSAMKLFQWIGWTGMLASAALAASGSGISSYQDMTAKRNQYSFEAWPKGSTESVRFISAIYLRDSVAYVRMDEGLFQAPDDSKIRYPEDFDSLRASKYVPRGTPLAAPVVWHKAVVAERRWGFPRLTGKVSLYASEPERAAYVFMDTGAGIERYSEAAVRAKISGHPGAARLLRREKAGHVVAWTMAGVGGGLAVAGLAATAAGVEGGTPGTVALLGLAIAGVSWIPHLSTQGKYEEAIRAYNGTP
jgi:hypothetical protein